MGCRNCKTSNLFRKKLGRCRQCMTQLAILSLSSWSAWFYFYLPTPKAVESITLLFAASAFSLLLIAHGGVATMRWFKKKDRPQQAAP
ncbi:DUF3624 domain-containing protein [uncultured Photobacterium sp.]|uniref:DUF3624 domain-containing protein n=1 Tax=uncultured Photobacterium sp. TaxID=173973 RepID=UPI002635BA2C|nr:DUF3624 domain-containing protein [uncultured Photobacterium sp.]